MYHNSLQFITNDGEYYSSMLSVALGVFVMSCTGQKCLMNIVMHRVKIKIICYTIDSQQSMQLWVIDYHEYMR